MFLFHPIPDRIRRVQHVEPGLVDEPTTGGSSHQYPSFIYGAYVVISYNLPQNNIVTYSWIKRDRPRKRVKTFTSAIRRVVKGHKVAKTRLQL
ncbi:hypothetical protein Y032_0254g297 [Ancylostoma ceylanicum]|nr:hypothetical protein Y032_0254g297 [Ancylostoma ceylanicum]